MKQVNVTATRDLKIGDTVNSWGFVDCFGKKTTDKVGYVIVSITAQASKDLPYYRIKATNPKNGFEYVEGAERFFEVA